MMKKMLVCLVFLFTFVSSAFSGNMGYIWMPSRSAYYDAISYGDVNKDYILKEDLKKGLPDINSIIRIEAKNKMYFDFNLIQHIAQEFNTMVKDGRCSDLSGSYSNFMLNESSIKECSVDSVIDQIKGEYRKNELLYSALEYPIKAKIIGYVEFQAGLFVLVTQKELLREEKKDK